MPIDYPDLYTMWLECRSLAQQPLKALLGSSARGKPSSREPPELRA